MDQCQRRQSGKRTSTIRRHQYAAHLYCVRTAADIIFENELARLGRSQPNFNYEVCLSRPDTTWKGHSGRLTGEFVSQYVIDLASPTFFLCGPEGFMNNARQILSTLGVDRDRILQESFGESRPFPESRPLEARSVETVVFLRSEKVCQIFPGSTLLDGQSETACRFLLAAARANAVRAQLGF